MKRIKLTLTILSSVALLPFGSKAQWSLSGNSVTSGQFLGTTNTTPLVLKQNNITMGEIRSNNVLLLGKNLGGDNPMFQDNTYVFGHNVYNDDSFSPSNSFAIGRNIYIGAPNEFILGYGISPSSLLYGSGTESSLSVGFNSSIPTFFVGPSSGVGTTGNVGIGTTGPIEKLEVNGAIRLGTTATNYAGTIRYTGSDFEGYVGGQWKSFTAQGSGSSQWTGSGNINYGSGTVTIGSSMSSNAKFNVLGDAFITNKYYYHNQYSVAAGSYVQINLNATTNTLLSEFAYRVELVTSGTGAVTGSVYIVRQTSGTTWVAVPVNVTTISGSNSPMLRVNGNKLEIYHNHPSAYNIKTYVTSIITNNATVTGPGFFGLEGALSVIDGNLGVGTTTPLSALHSNGTLTVGSVTSAGTIGAIQLTSAAGSPISGRLTFGTDGSGWGFRIAKNQAGTVTDFVTVKDNGNVGIGTTDPAQKLSVAGRVQAVNDNSYGFTHVTNNTANTGFLTTYKNGADNNFWLMTGKIGTATEPHLLFGTGGYERMRITSDGKVGIGGVTAPSGSLEVKGDMNLGNAVNGQRWLFHTRTFAQSDQLIIAPDDASGTPDFTKAFGIDRSTGKVYIGSVTLPGNYRLYVKDGILAEKVKVAVSGTGNWADYVFADNYELISLSTVESFIRKNKHLPGVPSAEEVVKNGVDMAEMDATLLKKVEELTLYMIEQNKQILEQNKRLEKLERENELLKTEIKTK
ncbi:MAG: hypothetical protein V4651_00490 [Bacteroidota bacterium]